MSRSFVPPPADPDQQDPNPPSIQSCAYHSLDAAGRFVRVNANESGPQGCVAEQLHRANQEQSAILDNDLVAIVKLKGRAVTWVNRATRRIFGYAAEELIGKDGRLLYPSDVKYEHVSGAAHATLQAGGAFRSQIEMLRKSGERIWVDVSGVLLPGESQESLWFLADITELKRYQESFERMAHLDSLTGLPNRILLADRMEQALALARRHRYWTAVCYVDLDGFKNINDNHGHGAGDLLLQEIARRMQAAIRNNDTVARLGGDEFALLLTHVESKSEVEQLLNRVIAQIALPVALDDGRAGAVTASIGVALSVHDDLAPEELLRRADAAMYAAKKLGKNQVHFYRDAPLAGVPSVH